MSATTSTGRPTVINGYDLQAEKKRYAFPDAVVGSHRLNRADARVSIHGDMEAPRIAATRDQHLDSLFMTTHDNGAPVLELGYPNTGSYVMCSAGTYLDMYLGCAQKILDEQHPSITSVLEALSRYGLLIRREINSDDYLLPGPGVEGIYTPQDLATALNESASKRFPGAGGYKTFLSNSGAEAVEAGIKICYVTAYKRLVESQGHEVIAKMMAELGISRIEELDRYDTGDSEPVYRDYPFVIVATIGSFHGRTLGALSLTQSRKSHQKGYPKLHVRHIPYNGNPQDLADLIDPRPLTEILETPGALKELLDSGRFPKELFAGFVAEGFQGEGGYVPGDVSYFRGIEAICRDAGALLVADEVQAWARTGAAFSWEHFGVEPDVITMAKSAFVGATLARADLEAYMHGGWHSNTFGGGKIFDTNIACAVVKAFDEYKDPLFQGLSYEENEIIKGQYLQARLEGLVERHPGKISDIAGRGVMYGFSVPDREAFVMDAWKKGLKLLGCGPDSGGRIRVLFLADVLTKEIDDFVDGLDGLLGS